MRTALLAIALVVIGACSHDKPSRELADVTRDDLVIGVDVVGELEALDSTDVKPPPLPDVWDFKIASMAPEGIEVKEGDPIVGFDDSNLIRSLEEMQNEAEAAQKKLDKKRDDAALARRDDELKIAEAEAAVKKAKLKADAPGDLVASIDAKVVQLDAQSAELALAAARQKADRTKSADEGELHALADKAAYAKRRVTELQTNIARMQVKAPRAGTLVYSTDWQGEKHKVGDQVWRMAELVKVVSLGKMRGAGQVDEVDMARIAVGQHVSLRLDALPDALLHGKVESIAKSVGPKSGNDPSKIVKLRIALDPTTVPLRPGMRFRGQVETETLPKVVQVPAEAVFVRPDGVVAYRQHGGSLERVPLVVGRRSTTAIEIKSGLAPGDRVSRVDPEAR